MRVGVAPIHVAAVESTMARNPRPKHQSKGDGEGQLDRTRDDDDREKARRRSKALSSVQACISLRFKKSNLVDQPLVRYPATPLVV